MRAHLEVLAERGNRSAIAKLEGPEPPEDLLYLLDYAKELDNGRRIGMNGPEQISWMDLHAWSILTGRQLDPFEASTLMLIDSIRLSPGALEVSEP